MSLHISSSDERAFNVQLTDLYRRGRKLRAWARSFGMLAGVAVIALMGCLLLVRAEAPATELASVDVPTSVIDHFAKADIKKHVDMNTGAPFSGVAENTEPVVSSLVDAAREAATGPVAFTLSILGVVAFGVIIIFMGEEPLAGLARPALAICIGVSSINVVTAVVGGIGSAARPTLIGISDSFAPRVLDPKADFLAAVREDDLCKLISAIGKWDGWDLSYVLAQVYLRPHVCYGQPPKFDKVGGKAEVVDRAFLQALSKNLDQKPGFTPNGEVAYLVDMKGYGEPVSALSKRYLDERANAVGSWSFASKVVALVAGLLSAVTAGLFFLSRAILGRTARIRPDFGLLEPSSAPTASARK